MTRQSGYYWVKIVGVRWEIARWSVDLMCWFVVRGSSSLLDSDLDKINETRILAPDEVSDE